MHFDWSVHKLLEGRDAPIKNLVATVSFALEPQKPLGEMLPDFLAVRGASTASKRLLLDAKDHLLQPHLQSWASSPSLHLLTRPYRKQSFCTTFFFAQILPSFLLSLTCHCFDGKLKKLLPWLSLYVPPQGKLTETFIMLLCIEHFLTNQIN